MKKRKKRSKGAGPVDYAVYLAARLIVLVLGRASRRFRMTLARGVGRFMARCLPLRRSVVMDQLLLAFPDWEPARRAALLPEIYSHLVAFGLETMALGRISTEEMIEGVDPRIEGEEHLRAFVESPQPFILLTAHLGSLEWAGAYVTSRGLKLATPAKPLHNPWLDRYIMRQRERWGMKVIRTGRSQRPLVEHLRGGGVVGLIGDQDARRKGIFVPFFGRPASTFTGPAALALMTGAPIVPMWGFRTPEGRLHITIDEPIRPNPEAEPKQEIERLTRAHVALLEAAIRRDPGQYWWMHRRWKTRPEPCPTAPEGNPGAPPPEEQSSPSRPIR